MDKFKILLVEDHSDSRTVMSLFLRRKGFHVVEAATGFGGIAKLDGQSIALLDVNLPDISGVEVLKHIRQQKHKTLVAFVTATGPGALKDLEDLAPDAIFKKPIDFVELLRWIEKRLADSDDV